MSRVAVVGAGSWGTAFTGLVAANASEVTLWCHSQEVADGVNERHRNPRYLTSFDMAPNVRATASLAEAVLGAEAVVLALPSTHLRRTCVQLAPSLPANVPLLTLTKGIEPHTGLLMTEVAADALGGHAAIAALSGPNHAEEVCQGSFAAAVVASEDAGLSEFWRSLVTTSVFRVYTSGDVRGVEVCGAVKNVIAIACGICAGSGLGDNTQALIMTRGLAEIGRVVSALGGLPMTCMGLAGMGDLVATCTSEHSRNRRFGEAFARGVSLEPFERDSHMVVEGARAVVSVRELARSRGVDVPLCDAVWSVIYGGASIAAVSTTLTGRAPTSEFYGMRTNKNTPAPSHA